MKGLDTVESLLAGDAANSPKFQILAIYNFISVDPISRTFPIIDNRSFLNS